MENEYNFFIGNGILNIFSSNSFFFEESNIFLENGEKKFWGTYLSELSEASYTLIAKYTKTITKCKKQKVYNKVFLVTFAVFCDPFFTFSISQHLQQGRHSREKLKNFVINKTQNSHEI